MSRVRSCIACFLVVAASSAARGAEEVPGTVAKPDELKVLDRLVGTWTSETVMRVAEWNPKELKITGRLTRAWALDGWFVHETATDSLGVKAEVKFTFDPFRRVYRFWHFNSLGHSSDSTGSWDEKGQTLNMGATLPDGKVSKASIRFVDADTHEWSVKVTDAAGTVFFDASGVVRRAK
jgi:hypothetical protein